jgi:hypothetical protein
MIQAAFMRIPFAALALFASMTVSGASALAAQYHTKINFDQENTKFSLEGGSHFSVAESPTQPGNKVGRFALNDGRTEMKTERLPKDTDVWAGWSVFIPKDFPYPEAVVSQFHGFSSCSKGHTSGKAGIYKIMYDEKGWEIDAERLPKGVTKILQPAVKGKWTHFLMNGNFSSTNGFFTLYIDGKKHELLKGHTFGECEGGPAFKAGVYKGEDGGSNDQAVVMVDNVKIVINGSAADVLPPGATLPQGVTGKSGATALKPTAGGKVPLPGGEEEAEPAPDSKAGSKRR